MIMAMPGDATKNPYYQGMEGRGPFVENFRRFQSRMPRFTDMMARPRFPIQRIDQQPQGGLAAQQQAQQQAVAQSGTGGANAITTPAPTRGYVEPGRPDMRMGLPTPPVMPISGRLNRGGMHSNPQPVPQPQPMPPQRGGFPLWRRFPRLWRRFPRLWRRLPTFWRWFWRRLP